MALPTKAEVEALDYAGPGGPRARVSASRSISTGSLDYATAGGPTATGSPTTPETEFPCGSEPHAEIAAYMRSDGAEGSLYRSEGKMAAEAVFPPAGGINDFSLRFWLRRPVIPVRASGVLTQIKNGLSRLTVSVAVDQTLSVSVTDGTLIVSRTITPPLVGFEWSSLTLAHDALTGILNVGAGVATRPGEIGLTMDLSGLTHAPATDTSTTVFANAEAASPLDADVIGWGLYGYGLPAEVSTELDEQGMKYDPRNAEADPDYFYREEEYDGAVPNAGCVGGGEGEVLVPVGGAGGETDFEKKGPDFVFAGGGLIEYSDEGGYEINVHRTAGNWPSRGPYRVQLVAESDQKLYPLGQEGCFGLEPGLGMDCYADALRRRIRFCLVDLPPGYYGLRIKQGSTVIASAVRSLRVLPRNRAWPEAYSIARNIGAYAEVAGQLVVTDEPEATPTNRPPYVPWEALVKAFGRALREVSGAPTTRLRGDHDEGALVGEFETVLGFPSEGWCWVDGRRIEYTGRSADDLEVTFPYPGLEEGAPGNTPVVLDVKVLAHPSLYREPRPLPAMVEGP